MPETQRIALDLVRRRILDPLVSVRRETPVADASTLTPETGQDREAIVGPFHRFVRRCLGSMVGPRATTIAHESDVQSSEPMGRRRTQRPLARAYSVTSTP
jgi:hypothetical protein